MENLAAQHPSNDLRCHHGWRRRPGRAFWRVMADLPVTVVTGFLGAGKTTLLASVLSSAHGRRIALILNELGQAGIEAPPASSRFLELTQGCVCCLRNPDLLAAMDELHARGDVDHVLLETTGVADPLALGWTLARPELRGKARLDAVITVVDPTTLAAARGSHEWESQVLAADVVALTKLDVATAEQAAAAREAVRALNPQARVVDARELPASVVLDTAVPHAAPAGHAHADHSGFEAVPASGGVYRLEPLEDWLEALPAAIFRAKGIVRLDDGRWASFQVVGGRLDLRLGVPPPDHGETRMAFIGRGLDGAEIERALARARS
jgi:G3E family GTPase